MATTRVALFVTRFSKAGLSEASRLIASAMVVASLASPTISRSPPARMNRRARSSGRQNPHRGGREIIGDHNA